MLIKFKLIPFYIFIKMKKIISLFLISFSVVSFAQMTKGNLVQIDSTKKFNSNEINSYLKTATNQVYIKNNGFKKEVNYFSKLPFGENTIGNYDFKKDKSNNSFVENFANILLNSKQQ